MMMMMMGVMMVMMVMIMMVILNFRCGKAVIAGRAGAVLLKVEAVTLVAVAAGRSSL